MKFLKNIGKLSGGALTFTLMLTLFLWNGVEARADIIENVSISEVEKYNSGSLKSFKLEYSVGYPSAGTPSPEAASRVAVQIEEFDSNNPFGEFGNYATAHTYTDWPNSPADCGFVTWGAVNGEYTFTRPATDNNHSITVTFAENVVNLNTTQTYYVYIWTYYTGGYGSHIYPDAFVYEFTAGQGDFTGSTPSNPNPINPSQPGNNNQSTSENTKTNTHIHNFQWTVIKEATEKTDGCTALMCEGCGHIEAKQPISFFNNIIYNVREEIKNAPGNGIVTIDNEFLRCFSDEMVEELLDRPDVTVVVNFTDKDVNYSFTIPAGKAPTDGQEWYGYYYLGSVYGWTLVEDTI